MCASYSELWGLLLSDLNFTEEENISCDRAACEGSTPGGGDVAAMMMTWPSHSAWPSSLHGKPPDASSTAPVTAQTQEQP